MEFLCSRCSINKVPHPKYLCLSCICSADGCVKAVRNNSTLCDDHQCVLCENVEGKPYISVTGKRHVLREPAKNEDIQLYIDYDVCPNNRLCSTFIGKCKYVIHCSICNEHDNLYPAGANDGFSGCEKFNLCSVKGCRKKMLDPDFDSVLMRCVYHYSKCQICDKHLLSDNTAYFKPPLITCDRCVLLKLVKCSRCKECKPIRPNFSDGNQCLNHYIDFIFSRNEMTLKINQDDIITNIDADIVYHCRYIYGYRKIMKKRKYRDRFGFLYYPDPDPLTLILTLPRDVFDYIMRIILSTPPIMSRKHYLHASGKCTEIILKGINTL